MKKKIQMAFAAAFLAVATWLFIWPAFGPYFTFVFPLPGTSEVKSIRVAKNPQGNWEAYVDYFFTGRPTESQIKIALLTGPEVQMPQDFNSFQLGRTAIRGTHTVKFEITRPHFQQEVTTKTVEAKLVDGQNGGVISSRSVELEISWSDRETYVWDQKIATQPRDALFKEALALVDRGDSRALVEAKNILERLVQKNPNFSEGIEQLVRISNSASWGPKGISKIESWKEMNSVVNGLYNANAYAELNQLAANLIESKELTADGFTKLRLFHHAVNNDYFDLGEIDEKHLKEIESANDDVESKWKRKVPGSYLPHILYAKSLMRAAWQIRGSGYANTVSKENWERFKSLAQRAVGVLAKCKSICDSDPEWYATMIETMHLASIERPLIAPIFVEGFTKFPWYQSIYVAMTITYAPKWGGSVENIESFARELASRFPLAEQNAVYGRLYDELYGYGNVFKTKESNSSSMNCSRAVNGFDVVTKRWPSNHNLNIAARMAKRCGDKLAARRFLEKVGNNADLTVWTSADFSNAVAWAK